MAGEFARVTRSFFDKPKVAKAIDAKTRRVLSKFGAFTRRDAQTSMRPGKKPSPAGQPPRSRGKKLLRKLLFFSDDSTAKKVVIGPLRLDRTAEQHVPRALDEGGVIVRRDKVGKAHRNRYGKHPYMRPAFDRNIRWVADEYHKGT